MSQLRGRERFRAGIVIGRGVIPPIDVPFGHRRLLDGSKAARVDDNREVARVGRHSQHNAAADR